MTSAMSDSKPGRHWGVVPFWIVVMAIVAWAYWPGLHGPLLLDDFANLAPLDVIDLQKGFAQDVVSGNSSGPLGRPLSMATFALEKLYLDNGPYGQKLFGLVLHLLNGCLVFLLSLRIFRAMGTADPRVSLLVAAFWLSAPLLLSTTLYVVQRMTLLSALFTLLALVLYCTARELQLQSRRAWPFVLCALVSAALAVLAKENGLLTLPLMTTIEIYVYRFRSASEIQRKALATSHGLIFILPILALLVLSFLTPDLLYGGYKYRDFTLVERLMTEARILFDYIVQLLWPNVHTLGVYHDDFEISRTWLQPATTLPAILVWLLLGAALLLSAVTGYFMLPAFGLAFFLVAHAMESSVFSLELYFEHRNYVPAVGILIGLVAFGRQLTERLVWLRPWLFMLCLLVIARNVGGLGSQAVVWSDRKLLQMEAVNYHPGSDRALLELAQVYALEDHLDEALGLVGQTTMYVESDPAPGAVLKAIYYCLARQAMPSSLLAHGFAGDSAIVNPTFNTHVYYLVRMVLAGKCVESDTLAIAVHINEMLTRDGDLKGTPKLFAAMMLLDNQLGRYREAMVYAEHMLARNPDDVMALQFQLYLATLLEMHPERASAQERLERLRDAGRLNVQESYNLELFLDKSG